MIHSIISFQNSNNNLEQQAQILYKSWFIDLDPSGGTLPANWASITLGEIATIKTQSFNPLKNPKVLIEHYSIPAFDETRYPVFEMAENIKSNKYYINKRASLISKLNPETKRVWRPYCLSKTAVCSTEFIVYEPKNNIPRDFIYSIIDSNNFSSWACAHTTGSTNSRQRVTPKDTLDFKLLLPDPKTLEEFISLVTPLYDLIEKNIVENRRLIQLKDSLLPKLISGEIDISTIEI